MDLLKWRCKVCGYVHEGDAPPDECPICGVGPEEFEQLQEAVAAVIPKQWKCTVCEYIHSGDEPPERCPICGVGPEDFVLLGTSSGILSPETINMADERTSRAALEKIGYGLYVVTSRDGDNINGQCANTVFQLTSHPPRIAVCLNKRNLTHDYVRNSGLIAVSVLRQGDLTTVGRFGYRSGREMDKFEGIEYLPGRNGCPLLAGSVAYIEAQVLPDKLVDVGTHTLFVADVTSGGLIEDTDTMTYAAYRRQKTQ